MINKLSCIGVLCFLMLSLTVCNDLVDYNNDYSIDEKIENDTDTTSESNTNSSTNSNIGESTEPINSPPVSKITFTVTTNKVDADLHTTYIRIFEYKSGFSCDTSKKPVSSKKFTFLADEFNVDNGFFKHIIQFSGLGNGWYFPCVHIDYSSSIIGYSTGDACNSQIQVLEIDTSNGTFEYNYKTSVLGMVSQTGFCGI